MVCEQCGAEIPSGLSDCDVCGAHNDDTAQTGAMPANGIAPKNSPSGELSGESQNDTLTPTGFDYCMRCGKQTPPEAQFCEYCGTPRHLSHGTNLASVALQSTGTASRRLRRLLITAAAIAAVVLAVVVLLITTLNVPADTVVYCKQDAVIAANLDSLKAVELSDGLAMPDDGFILGFYTFCSPDGRYLYYPEPDDESVTIYRRDLYSDPKDSHAAVKIDSDIGYPFEVTQGNKAVYLKQTSGGLYVNDGENKDRIALDVSYFELSEDGTKLVYTGIDGDICFVDMRELSEEKLAPDATLLCVSDDFSTVYYDKNGGLFVQTIGGEKTRIATDISGFVARMDDGTVYYTKSQTQTVTLADLLNDDMKDADNALSEPDIAAFQTQQPYINFWGETAYEIVTDEEAYNAALTTYSTKLHRDEIRAQAASMTMDFFHDTLFAYSGGEETAVCDDFAYSLCASDAGLLVYKKYVFAAPEKINISDIDDTYDLNMLFNSLQSEDGCVYAATFGAETQLIEANTRSLATDNSFVYAPEDGKLYYLDDYDTAESCGTLYVINVTNGDFSDPQMVDEDVSTFALDGCTNTLLYIKNMQNGCGDLCRDGVKIDSDVSPGGMLLSKDGTTLYYLKDFSANGGTLMTYAGGMKKRIAYDVSDAAIINDQLIFLADYSAENQQGDLYLYHENESRLIDDSVSGMLDTQRYRQLPQLDFMSPELLDAE